MNEELIKLYANLILDKSITITPYTANNQVLFNYEHNSIISTIIKRNRYNFLHEFNDTTILRDATYSSYYESLLELITNQDYTPDDMNTIVNDLDTQRHEITRTFTRLLIGYTNNHLREQLTDSTRRDQSGNSTNYIKTKTIYDEELLKNTPHEEFNEEEICNPLYDLLTESEKQFVRGEKVYASKNVEKTTKSRIKRRLKKMTEKQKQAILDSIETEDEIVNKILDIEDTDEFIKEIRAKQEQNWFADLLIEYVPAQHRQDFNRNNITSTTIKEYRKALHKALKGRF